MVTQTESECGDCPEVPCIRCEIGDVLNNPPASTWLFMARICRVCEFKTSQIEQQLIREAEIQGVRTKRLHNTKLRFNREFTVGDIAEQNEVPFVLRTRFVNVMTDSMFDCNLL